MQLKACNFLLGISALKLFFNLYRLIVSVHHFSEILNNFYIFLEEWSHCCSDGIQGKDSVQYIWVFYSWNGEPNLLIENSQQSTTKETEV